MFLLQIDLSKRDGGEHPDIQKDKQYLIRRENLWLAAKAYHEVDFGWGFNCGCGGMSVLLMLFDLGIKEIYEIIASKGD